METRLKKLRTENKFKQNYVAKYLFITQTTYSNYESGERDIPLSILVKLSELN
ncbi:MAG: helix-turn-helix transcriptional regulator [Clostridia bacterium]|nr:helix-turn-helix transcriptional regulator [Clostridia bacterium]